MEPKYPGANCYLCPLRDEPFVPPAGPAQPQLIVVGEAPGHQEVLDGEPFVGKSGQLLQAVLGALGMSWDKVYRTNAVLCRPPKNRAPDEAELQDCSGALGETLRDDVPILGLGRTAQQALRLPKQFQWYNNRISTFHPAYILRNPDSFEYMVNTIRKALYFPWMPQIDPEVKVVKDLREIPDPQNFHGPVIWDLETSQRWFNKNVILCMGIADSADEAWIVPDYLLDAEWLQWFLGGLKDHGGHNIKFDMNFVAYHKGVEFTYENKPTIDTMLLHYCMKETTGGHGLKELCTYYFSAPDYEGPLVQQYLKNREDTYDKIPRPDLYQYATYDVCYNWLLWRQLEREVRDAGLWKLYKHLMEGSWAAHKMEMRGVKVDVEHLAKVRDRLEEENEDHTEWMEFLAHDALDEWPPDDDFPYIWDYKKDEMKYPPRLDKVLERIEDEFNPNSAQQVQFVMYGLLGLPTGTNEKEDKLTTNADTLHILEKVAPHEFVDELIMYRKKNKLLTSYVRPLEEKRDERDRVHTTLKLHGTETGRLSAIDPPLQTIPRPGDPDDPISSLGNYIRAAFIAGRGKKLVIADYAQAELRVAAAFSGDSYLLHAFETGRDVHGEVCRGMFGDQYTSEQRSETKRLVFCTLYGGTAYNFATDYAIPRDKAEYMYGELVVLLADFMEWRDTQLEVLRERGYVETILGRRRRMPFINDQNFKDARKLALNSPIQGSAHDLTMLSWIELTKRGRDTLFEVHDSILLEAPVEGAEQVGVECVDVMVGFGEQYFPQVPWKVDYDIRDRWGREDEG